jgi:hypothetical protein
MADAPKDCNWAVFANAQKGDGKAMPRYMTKPQNVSENLHRLTKNQKN